MLRAAFLSRCTASAAGTFYTMIPVFILKLQHCIKACVQRSLVSNPFLTSQQLVETIVRHCNVNRCRQTVSKYIKLFVRSP